MARRQRATPNVGSLPFEGVFNSDLFSNHWLEHRLLLEDEWRELREQSNAALDGAEALWRRERTRVEQYETEASLEKAFIQPLFELIGWKLIYQTYLQRREPDYALFLTDESQDAALAAGKRSPNFWNHPTVLADAKAWHISLDRPLRIGAQREYPPEQIEWYLEHSRVNYGILTNGRLWRLIPRQLQPGKARFQTYLEVDVAKLLNARLGHHASDYPLEVERISSEEFFRFFLFFGPCGFHGRRPLVQRAIDGSSEYALSVGEDLKKRVFEALSLCIEGFLSHAANRLDAARDLEECREQAFVLLYRLLFIMYAEDRGLLPFRRNDLYTQNRSLARHRVDIASTMDAIADNRHADYSRNDVTIWRDLVSLFDLVDGGRVQYAVPAYNGGLFDPERHPFLS